MVDVTRRWALPKWDRVRLMAFVLTPQCFSTSSLVFGPVLIHPRKYYTPRLSKVKDIFVNRDAHEIH
ncbi:MAG: hypothetical protein A2545_02480 [Planctomycetes bacterium RIFOXYD2_FULL_41_16]|nr:MAG: hypothetical protein A2094_02290 [Planctomycetes bacterium GWE2_41_14]OHC08015.1 MAG: hypothetical protein A2545_02480 [Planctomycetes bacterium RIFOXYD2_FULL_41_16]